MQNFHDLMKSRISDLIPDNNLAKNLIDTSLRVFKNMKQVSNNPYIK
jgi:hypothetical protein